MPARFAPFLLWEYRRDWAAALALLAVGACFAWLAWEQLPHQSPAPIEATGTIRELRPGLPGGSKYTAVHGPIAVLDVVMPGGGVQRFTGDGRLLERCRRGDSVHLARYVNDLGQSAWALTADSCGHPR